MGMGGGSMFAGLEVKTEPVNAVASPGTTVADPGGDMFSGMTIQPTAAPTSAFTFMSSGSNNGPVEDTEETSTDAGEINESESGGGAPSAFSFMSGGGASEESGGNSSGGGDGGLDFGGLTLKSHNENQGSALNFGGLTLKSNAAEHGSEGGLDFGGLQLKSHDTSEAPTSGGLDFGGLTLKTPEQPEAASLNFGGLTLKTQSEQSGVDFGGLTLSPPSSLRESTSEGPAAPPSTPAAGGFGNMKFNLGSVSTSLAAVADAQADEEDDENSLEAIQRRVDTALIQYWNSLEGIAKEESSARLSELALTAQIVEAQAAVVSLEAEQAAAIENEEYEKADDLSSQIDANQDTISRCTQEIAAAKLTYNSQGDKKRAQHESVLQQVEACFELIEQFQKDRETAAATYSETENSRIAQVTGELESEKAKLAADMEKSTAAYEAISAEEAQIQQAIDEDTKDVLDRKGDLESQKSIFEIELADLRKQLEEKEAQIASCTEQLEECNAEIDKARAGHETALQEIASRKSAVDAEANSAAEEQKVLDRRQAQLEEETTAKESKESEQATEIENIQADLKASRNLVLRVRAELESLADSENSLAEVVNSLAELQAEKEKTLSGIATAKEAKEAIETEIADHHQNIVNVDMKVPALEAEKTLAVTKKKYKEAASLKAELTKLQASKAESQAKIEALREKVQETTRDVVSQQEQLSQVQRSIDTHQAGTDNKRLQHLMNRQTYLKVLLAEAEKRTANGQGSYKTTVELKLYKTEFDLVDEEASKLRAKHGWPEDHVQAGNILVPGAQEITAELVAEQQSVKEKLETQISDLATKIETAVENEDFEAADELDLQSGSLTMELEKVQKWFDDNASDIACLSVTADGEVAGTENSAQFSDVVPTSEQKETPENSTEEPPARTLVCGGVSSPKPWDDTAQEIFTQAAAADERVSALESPEGIEYRTQVVAGVKYRLKVKHTEGFVHLVVMKAATDENGDTVTVLEFEADKEEGDTL
eukprot:CAMPEP_0175142332 /NCGR_PEP_ID=MMETSP0087-20121206/12731_1 /TAXON_ID=136419 /ORGANISM="Unknown Unknown, Strain D1" /LENGTH=1001 /DNA_ID=CAMNT_0016426105 /DNA_START=1 /DNA_END=3006 /DNA_ORIENTATION=-